MFYIFLVTNITIVWSIIMKAPANINQAWLWHHLALDLENSKDKQLQLILEHLHGQITTIANVDVLHWLLHFEEAGKMIFEEFDYGSYLQKPFSHFLRPWWIIPFSKYNWVFFQRKNHFEKRTVFHVESLIWNMRTT